MSSIPGQAPPPPKRKAVEQAMAVLRETRAKFDPAVLEVVRQKLSALVPASLLSTSQPSVPAPLVHKQPEKEELHPSKAPSPEPERRIETPVSKEVIKPQKIAAETPKPSDPNAEKVDRQKISRIVMEYMKLKQDKKTKH
jgi:hypothetical protein